MADQLPMKTRTVVLLALTAFLLTLVVRFPIAAVLAQVNTAPVVISNPSGTVWGGDAQRITFGGNHIDNFGWAVRLLDLLGARIGADINFTLLGGEGSASVSRSLGGDSEIKNAQLTLNAQSLAELIPGGLVELGGGVDVVIEEWRFVGQQPESLRADFTWHKAVLQSPVQAQLGKVSASVTPHSGGHSLQLENEGGHLQVSGKVDVDKAGGYRADIRLKPRANAPADIDGTLGFLGQKRADGSYRLRRNGRLRDFL